MSIEHTDGKKECLLLPTSESFEALLDLQMGKNPLTLHKASHHMTIHRQSTKNALRYYMFLWM